VELGHVAGLFGQADGGPDAGTAVRSVKENFPAERAWLHLSRHPIPSPVATLGRRRNRPTGTRALVTSSGSTTMATDTEPNTTGRPARPPARTARCAPPSAAATGPSPKQAVRARADHGPTAEPVRGRSPDEQPGHQNGQSMLLPRVIRWILLVV